MPEEYIERFKKCSLGLSDDYAVIKGPGFSFYYGYEETDAEDNWLFKGKAGKLTLIATAEEMGREPEDNVENILMSGIALFMTYFLEANKLRDKKIKSLEKQISKLEKIDF